MTKIKFCGLSRPCEIAAVNRLKPAYIGFVFAPKSRRYLTPEAAADLKRLLAPGIQTVGVFVNEAPQTVAKLLEDGILDLAQLHGDEDENYLAQLRRITSKPIIQAFRISGAADIERIERSTADAVLIDSGAGTGTVFDWNAILHVKRPYFLAGGLSPDNVGNAICLLHPYAVDVSSGIETDGCKDQIKMAAFAAAVRKENRL